MFCCALRDIEHVPQFLHLCEKENHKHNHAHFHCEKCTKTICLNGVEFPKIIHPAGFKVKETYYVMQGVCSKCQ